MKIIFLCLLLCFALLVHAQNNDQYSSFVKQADSLTKEKKYLEAAKAFSAAFTSIDGKAFPNDRYNAACAWALAGMADSAFFHLFRLADGSAYSNYRHITTDEDLKSLHPDTRWNILLEKVAANLAKEEANLIKPLVAELRIIYEDDQFYRKDIEKMIADKGRESPEVKEWLRLMDIADSINYVRVSKILDEYGWLGRDKIGDIGAHTLFLVIQHAPLDVQTKYLPMLKEAVMQKRASSHHLAMLEDRIATRTGREQLYGTQLMMNKETGKPELLPLADPDGVDERRAAVGLGPLSEFLKIYYGIDWDLASYKKTRKQH